MRLHYAIFALLIAAGSAAGCAGCDDDPGTGGTPNSTDNNGQTNSQTNGQTNSQTNGQTNSQTNGQTNSNTNNNQCVPDPDADICAAAGAECGTATLEDNCGGTGEFECGTCPDGETCSDDNTCECVDTEAEICAREMKDCGTIMVVDECGVDREVDCGTCMDGEECGDDNVCACPCTIDGECVPDGMLNPENPCEVCDPATTTDEWTQLAVGSACEDGVACTSNSTCTADGECSEGELDADTCLINGTCYTDGEADPSSDCRSCDATANTEDWTNAPQGSMCDDELVCTSGDTCDGAGECVPTGISDGTCAIDGACYNQDEVNPNNPCQVCDPTQDQADWSNIAENTACDDELACTSNTFCDGAGECVGDIADATCAIDGVCYNDGEANPNEVCQVCDAATLQDDWSGAMAGDVCNDGLDCTSSDVCDGTGECEGTLDADACLIQGTCHASGDIHPGRDCLFCDPMQDPNDWTFLPIDSPCDDGLPCTGDGTCNPGGNCRAGTPMAGTCAIDDACYNDGDVNPANECESCQPGENATQWSPLEGNTCDDGLDCTSNTMCNADGECVGDVDADSCVVDETCVPDGSENPDNDCELCDVDETQTDWSPAAQDVACDDDLDCTTGEVCDGGGTCGGGTLDADTCAIDDACWADGDVNPANVCEICDAAAETTDWTANDDVVCDDGDMLACTGVCIDRQCQPDLNDPDSCAIDNACYASGDTNPMNECEVCDPTDDPLDWSLAADGTTCAMGNNLCCAGDCLAVNACP